MLCFRQFETNEILKIDEDHEKTENLNRFSLHGPFISAIHTVFISVKMFHPVKIHPGYTHKRKGDKQVGIG